jgi:hypothetical protein
MISHVSAAFSMADRYISIVAQGGVSSLQVSIYINVCAFALSHSLFSTPENHVSPPEKTPSETEFRSTGTVGSMME